MVNLVTQKGNQHQHDKERRVATTRKEQNHAAMYQYYRRQWSRVAVAMLHSMFTVASRNRGMGETKTLANKDRGRTDRKLGARAVRSKRGDSGHLAGARKMSIVT